MTEEVRRPLAFSLQLKSNKNRGNSDLFYHKLRKMLYERGSEALSREVETPVFPSGDKELYGRAYRPQSTFFEWNVTE